MDVYIYLSLIGLDPNCQLANYLAQSAHRCECACNNVSQSVSIASVKGVNRAILDRRAKLASKLSRRA